MQSYLFTKKSSDAVNSAIDMLSKLAKLNNKRVKEGLPSISIGIGINTVCDVRNIRSSG